MTDSSAPTTRASMPADVKADWIDHADALAQWLEPVAEGDRLGMDTEFMRQNTFHPQLALLQLGHGERRALVDPLAFDPGDILQRQLGERDVTCVMHSPGEDMEVLAPQLPAGPAVLFDTQLAAAFVGMGLGMSYRALVAELTGVELDKGETRSNWMQRPLTASQKLYAALDVVYLGPLHEQLAARLAERGREAWHAEDCERLKQRASRREGDPQPQRDFRGAADWSRPRRAMLRRIARWRDRMARELDTPRPWLLQDAQIMNLAQDPPRSSGDLAERTRGQRALRGAQRQALLDLLQTPPDDVEIAETAGIPPHPTGEAKRRLGVMKEAVDKQAKALDIPPGLLCPRKVLELLVVTEDWPEALEGWRRDVLHPILTPLLA